MRVCARVHFALTAASPVCLPRPFPTPVPRRGSHDNLAVHLWTSADAGHRDRLGKLERLPAGTKSRLLAVAFSGDFATMQDSMMGLGGMGGMGGYGAPAPGRY